MFSPYFSLVAQGIIALQDLHLRKLVLSCPVLFEWRQNYSGWMGTESSTLPHCQKHHQTNSEYLVSFCCPARLAVRFWTLEGHLHEVTSQIRSLHLMEVAA